MFPGGYNRAARRRLAKSSRDVYCGEGRGFLRRLSPADELFQVVPGRRLRPVARIGHVGDQPAARVNDVRLRELETFRTGAPSRAEVGLRGRTIEIAGH